MRKHAAQILILGLVLLVGAACAPEGETPEAGAEVRLVEGTRSEPGFPEARLSFDAPDPGVVLPDTAVHADLDLTGYELAVPTPGGASRGLAMSEQGQHVHVILDNEPYRAIYDAERAVDFTGLTPGLHVLRAFPSRQWHESVKTPGAFAWTYFFVQDTSDGPSFDPEAPLLTYSRPKGIYEGSASDSIMVDFYLTNAELGPDAHSVRLTVDDTLSFSITTWAPHYVLGLPGGQHTFKLDLLAPDGTLVPSPLNTTTRTITVADDEAESES